MKLKFIYLQAEPCSFSTLFYLTDDEFIAHERKLTKTSGNHKVRGIVCTLGDKKTHFESFSETREYMKTLHASEYYPRAPAASNQVSRQNCGRKKHFYKLQ